MGHLRFINAVILKKWNGNEKNYTCQQYWFYVPWEPDSQRPLGWHSEIQSPTWTIILMKRDSAWQRVTWLNSPGSFRMFNTLITDKIEFIDFKKSSRTAGNPYVPQSGREPWSWEDELARSTCLVISQVSTSICTYLLYTIIGHL